MKLICQLFGTLSQNATNIPGICHEQLIKTAKKPNLDSQTQSVFQKTSTALYDKSELYHYYNHNDNENTAGPPPYDDHGAAVFISVVICFYSLSIVCMFIINIKFKIVMTKTSPYCMCDDSRVDEYESQKDETKNTIHLIFNDSSKLLSSVALAKLTNSASTPNMTPTSPLRTQPASLPGQILDDYDDECDDEAPRFTLV